MIKLLATLLVWVGCLLPYLASSRQMLIRHRIGKLPAWCGFVVLLVIAFCILNSVYSSFIAVLVVLALVMCSWVIITLMSAHLSGRLLKVCAISIGIFSVITFTGGFYGV